MPSAEVEVRDLSRELSAIKPQGETEEAIYGLVLGALYALARATSLGYSDRTGASVPLDYADELVAMAAAMGDSREPSGSAWQAGFYFNSALYRIASASERLEKYAGTNRYEEAKVRREVNRIKHHEWGLLPGRRVPLDEAIDSARSLTHRAIAVLGRP